MTTISPLLKLKIIKVLAAIFIIAGSIMFVYHKGFQAARYKCEAEWESKIRDLGIRLAEAESKSQEVTIQTIIEYADRVQIVKEKGNDIIKKIPVYITKEVSANCVVPSGFVVLHNAAAGNTTLPDAP